MRKRERERETMREREREEEKMREREREEDSERDKSEREGGCVHFSSMHPLAVWKSC